MPRNRTVLIGVAAALALQVLALVAPAQDRPAPRQVLRTYLTQDCGTGDPQPDLWLRRVVALGDEAVPVLAEAVRQGPPATLREEVQGDAAQDFDRLRSFVEEGGLEAIQEDEVVRLAQELDRSTYVAMRLRSFDRPYRERALKALAVMDSAKARASLEQLAEDPNLDPDLAEQASAALRRDG